MTDSPPDRPVSMHKPTQTLPVVPGPLAPPQPMLPAPTGYHPVPTPVPFAAPMPYPTTTVVPQQSNAEIVVAWIFTALTLLYMLPWAIAASRRSTNSILIAVATFFLAWTVVGWLAMLVLSFLGPTVYTTAPRTTFVALPPPPPGMWAQCPSDPPHVRRWWDGRAWTPHTTVV